MIKISVKSKIPYIQWMDLKKKTGGLRGVRGMWSKEKSNVRVTGRFHTSQNTSAEVNIKVKSGVTKGMY